MDEIKIKLVSTKNSFVKSVSVWTGICWRRCFYMIQYSIYHNFSVFCKNFNLESMNIFKNQLSHHGIQWDWEKNLGNYQLIYSGVNRRLVAYFV